MLDALRIQQDAEMIAFTHWTFNELDEQPALRMAEMRTYMGIKADVEKRKMKMETQRRAKGKVGR